MDPDFSPLDDHLDGMGADGYLVHADSEQADQYYLSGFDAPDPFTTLFDGNVHLLMARSLEYGRAKREARAATVERDLDYGLSELTEEHGPVEGRYRAVARFLEAYGVESVATPPSFPLAMADGLRATGVEVTADRSGAIGDIRATKTPAEVEHIRTAQRANENAMARAESVIADAEVGGDGILRAQGEPLTSEAVQAEIEVSLVRDGCSLSDTIVAGGQDAADPHERGSGPLRADEPIIVDIFPQHKVSHYHADMTRTFARGDPGESVREWFDLTDRARRAAIETIEPGVSGGAVHDAACDVYEEADLPTLRSDPDTETGFIHGTGHGVGLEVHEGPSLRPDAPDLQPGNVVTVEPGLYDPAVGGVRIEDLLLVTEDGYENLADYPIQFVLE